MVRTACESIARLPVVNDQGSQGPFAQLPGHATAELRVGNLAREEKIDRRGEKSRVLDEEWTLLREKNRKALIDCHLRVVGFHLAEVRIQRDVKRERILDHEFRVEPRAVFKLIEESGRRGRTWRVGLVQEMIAGKKAVRNELNVAPRRHVFNSIDRRELLGQSFHP